MRRPPLKSLVWLYWRDAEAGRVDRLQVAETGLAINVNLGWVIDENRERIVLAHGGSSTGEVDVLKIPRSQITKIIPVAKGA